MPSPLRAVKDRGPPTAWVLKAPHLKLKGKSKPINPTTARSSVCAQSRRPRCRLLEADLRAAQGAVISKLSPDPQRCCSITSGPTSVQQEGSTAHAAALEPTQSAERRNIHMDCGFGSCLSTVGRCCGAGGELTAHSPTAVRAQLDGRKRYRSGSPRGS